MTGRTGWAGIQIVLSKDLKFTYWEIGVLYILYSNINNKLSRTEIAKKLNASYNKTKSTLFKLSCRDEFNNILLHGEERRGFKGRKALVYYIIVKENHTFFWDYICKVYKRIYK